MGQPDSAPDAPGETPFRLPDGSGPDAPVFSEPWQAQAFALAVALHARGLFTWAEWAAELSRQVARPGAAQDGSDYYQHWLATIEALLMQKGVAGPDVINALSSAWQRAAHATPHGQPIKLENDPERA
ncbi:nitrile hydratase accessory protein [Hoeflea sp. IMCC20628]|uniref:nitrile hydratase accessory protein n=1 Tax=Hoeflea sp. IMCC20628 TaxID=1620421 RepID=UPI00063BEC06|nr:nitrile hydratase accessory protein [Hoeflea sp. IMCC20628]AKI01286.1 nitrile hydratase accessory protein [Hoeflea sp. IMCC20628]